jgi:predicted amidophosphoribosyltransferase
MSDMLFDGGYCPSCQEFIGFDDWDDCPNCGADFAEYKDEQSGDDPDELDD